MYFCRYRWLDVTCQIRLYVENVMKGRWKSPLEDVEDQNTAASPLFDCLLLKRFRPIKESSLG